MKMKAIVVVGTQWGDEGKGKIIDLLAQGADYIVRYQGGGNAGHTVVTEKDEFVFHLVPSGILVPEKICILGNGVVIDPLELMKEIEMLKEKGIKIDGRFFVSENAHITLPYHRKFDLLREEARGGKKLGVTTRGIGPTYMDKIARVGIKAIEFIDEEIFKEKLQFNLFQKMPLLKGEESDFSFEKIFNNYSQYQNELKKYLANTSKMLNDALREGKCLLFEGAQGTLLDIDFGSYPYVTSSNPIAAGACTGTGISPKKIDLILGVTKAYTTRVGEGPFPSELPSELETEMRIRGKEYGATTGRPRRCGWFDAVIVRYAGMINGLDGMFITKLDVLDEIPRLKICVAYRYQGKLIKDFPNSIKVLEECEPVYEEMPGWESDISQIKSFEALPQRAKDYLRKLEELTQVELWGISTGAQRNQVIFCKNWLEEFLSQ
jgi:adenylosuccinate synthase